MGGSWRSPGRRAAGRGPRAGEGSQGRGAARPGEVCWDAASECPPPACTSARGRWQAGTLPGRADELGVAGGGLRPGLTRQTLLFAQQTPGRTAIASEQTGQCWQVGDAETLGPCWTQQETGRRFLQGSKIESSSDAATPLLNRSRRSESRAAAGQTSAHPRSALCTAAGGGSPRPRRGGGGQVTAVQTHPARRHPALKRKHRWHLPLHGRARGHCAEMSQTQKDTVTEA